LNIGGFQAPELWGRGRGTYGKECDWWTLGVLIYALLFNVFPFSPDERNLDKIAPKFPNTISTAAQDFIKGLLKPNPDLRLCGARRLFNHEWLKDIDQVKLQRKEYPVPKHKKEPETVIL